MIWAAVFAGLVFGAFAEWWHGTHSRGPRIGGGGSL